MVHRIAPLAPSLSVAESIAATAPPSSPLSLLGGTSLRGTVKVPGDKSISHRALLFGAIADGTTRIEGLLPAEDPLSTAACLRAMGVGGVGDPRRRRGARAGGGARWPPGAR